MVHFTRCILGRLVDKAISSYNEKEDCKVVSYPNYLYDEASQKFKSELVMVVME